MEVARSLTSYQLLSQEMGLVFLLTSAASRPLFLHLHIKNSPPLKLLLASNTTFPLVHYGHLLKSPLFNVYIGTCLSVFLYIPTLTIFLDLTQHFKN